MSLLIAYVFMTCRMYHDKTRTKNKLSFVPFGLILVYLTLQVLGSVEYGLNQDLNLLDAKQQGAATWMVGQLTCLCWSQVLIVQSFEWELITSLISFQKDVPAEEILVRREEYMNTTEKRTTHIFILWSLYNLFFHVIKITIYFLKLQEVIVSENLFLKKTIWDCIFVVSLSFMLIMYGIRLLSVASAFHQTGH